MSLPRTDVHTALGEAEACDEAATIVLTGVGRAFCAGEDLKEFSDVSGDSSSARAHIASIQRVSRRIMFSDRIMVAAARGYAVGGGFEWLLNCDLAVAGSDLVAFLPELQLGQFPTGGLTYLLAMTTFAPRPANASATCLPRPRPPPVTSAVRPPKRLGEKIFSGFGSTIIVS